MKDRLPYEEQLSQQWDDLPLPDENMAWEDMKRRLEEDDDKGIIPIWLRGCGLWGILAVVLIGIGWWIVRPDKWGTKSANIEKITTPIVVENKTPDSNNTSTPDTLQTTTHSSTNKTANNTDTDSSSLITREKHSTKHIKDSPSKTDKKARIELIGISSNKTKIPRTQATTPRAAGNRKPLPATKKKTGSQPLKTSLEPSTNDKDEIKPVDANTQPPAIVIDTARISKPSAKTSDSLTAKTKKDSVARADSTKVDKPATVKKDSAKTKSISFSAGPGLHQLVPVDGQKPNPYNSAGRKGSLADYIPSVFARMYKNNKWFIQLEFRYGAPQYTKDILYQQAIVLDTLGPINNHLVTTSSRLKKTFYHQLPVSFNYFVLPNWSVGGGLVWNKFVSAVSQEQVNRRNITTLADSITRNEIITDKNDSLFRKSYFQALIETQYRWKRLSFGARYSFGLQPYIRFSLPGGVTGEERNKSLQLFIRYELWKSKNKK